MMSQGVSESGEVGVAAELDAARRKRGLIFLGLAVGGGGNLAWTLGDPAVAAVIVETITGSNARIVPPPEYYPRLRQICDRHGVLLICDEVMCGFGRTGKESFTPSSTAVRSL